MAARALFCALLAAGGAGAGEAEATLVLGGDVMLARLVTRTVLEEGPAHVWGDVLPLLREADLALVNLECVIAEGGEPFEPRRVFYFRAHPRTLDCLTLAGIDFVSLANNHALDYRAPALLECLERLDGAGIAHAGAGRNRAEAARPALLEAKGLRVGVVAFADHFREYAATEDSPGTHVLPVREESLPALEAGIREVRARGADLILVSAHWGPNLRPAPTPAFRAFARRVIEAGADAFWGHSAHIVQGVEIHRGKPILYDTGDLLDDYRVDPELRNDQACLFRLRVTRGRVAGLEIVPLLIRRMRVGIARGEEREAVVRRISLLCKEMGTVVRDEGGRLRIVLAPPGR